MTAEDATTLLEKRNPGWLVQDIRVSDDGYEAIMKEDPYAKAFTFVNYEDGMVYQRQQVVGSPLLDDEAIREENPELWKKITDVPNRVWLENVLYHCNVDGHEVESELDWFLDNLPGAPERVIKPLEELDGDTLAELQPYIYYGPPSTKLAAPRKAKPEEMEAHNG